VKLQPGLLAELRETVAGHASDGSGFDFVFHGGSGSSIDEIRAAVANGVVKMNFDTDMQYAFTHAIERHLDDRPTRRDRVAGTAVDKRIYDPRSWGRKAEQAMAARVLDASKALGSAGRTLARG
jgi:fructose-bisphosphate aldolase class II